MFYATEYAYGRTVVNNGNRADRVVAFTAKRLRDTWVSAGSEYDGPGARDAIKAKQRPAGAFIEDGDNEAWEVLARQRVSASQGLSAYQHELVGYDWGDPAHWRWVATESERELLSWARGIRQDSDVAAER